jgi:hypothetical protein
MGVWGMGLFFLEKKCGVSGKIVSFRYLRKKDAIFALVKIVF